MLYITTNSDNLYINDIEQHFNNIVDKSIFDADIYHKIMKYIDNAIYIENEIIETPLGRTHLTNLSTGCKTTLLLVELKGTKKYIPITECGINAIKCIFKLSKEYDLYAYMDYGFIIDDNTAECIIDGVKCCGASEVYHKLKG